VTAHAFDSRVDCFYRQARIEWTNISSRLSGAQDDEFYPKGPVGRRVIGL